MKNMKLMLAGTLVVGVAIGLWLAFVSQSGYTPRAKAAEGLNLSGGAKAAIEDYYATNGSFPVDNSEAGIADSISSRFVSSVSVRPGGVVEVTYGGTEPDQTLAGKVLILEAITDENSNDILWSCAIDHIAERHLPAACR